MASIPSERLVISNDHISPHKTRNGAFRKKAAISQCRICVQREGTCMACIGDLNHQRPNCHLSKSSSNPRDPLHECDMLLPLIHLQDGMMEVWIQTHAYDTISLFIRKRKRTYFQIKYQLQIANCYY